MALPSLSSGTAADSDQVVDGGTLRRAVFLDRDGVINRAVIRDGKPYPPNSAADLEIFPGVATSLQRLRAAGFFNIVVTNQPDVATGIQRLAEVESMHLHLRTELAIDAIKVCYHVDADNCACRKPKPGLLTAAAAEYGIDLARSYMIGDRWRDVEAGQAAGCLPPYFIDLGYLEKQPTKPYITVRSLPETAALILSEPLFNHRL